MVIIRASRCIYPIPLKEWYEVWKQCFPPLDEWYVSIGEKYVVFENNDFVYRMDEHLFNKMLTRVPKALRYQSLKRGKGVSRVEKSYNKKGVKKHETYHPT
ncbi:cytoplasmic protein [Bacillus pseudomycoides]|uniref:Cytoplasmic protein n=1 Tax=Bacillus pseudomycoides TaxID=64104 RepID=A0AA91ZU54_9BACI|nr:cytoplasmic protein [Bacillus pseudomycoides]PED82313.1 cytoplasmic protein [Bacillus pseudomycoides]